MRSGWWKMARGAAGLAVLGFLLRFLLRNWEAVRSAPLDWRLRPVPIAGSILLVLATYMLLVEAWRRMLASWGSGLPPWTAARIWVLSSMGKYIPGKVWAIAGMALMAQRAGVPAWAATASAILLQVIAVGSGALVVGLTGVGPLEVSHPGARVALLLLLLASAAGLCLVVWPPAARRLVALVAPQGGEAPNPGLAAVGFGIAANLVAWMGYGVALFWLARGVLPAAPLGVGEAVGVFTASYLAGLLFLLAPGGLVVREGVFILMLQSSLGPANAVALAAVSRLGMTIADALATLPFLLFRERPPVAS